MAKATTCRICGIEFEYATCGRVPLRCGSTECDRAYYRKAMRESRFRARAKLDSSVCAECSGPVGVVHGNKRYCSSACRHTALLRRRREREYKPPVLHCAHCSAEIAYKSGRRRYCSNECQLANAAKTARWRKKGLKADHGLEMRCGICGADDRDLVIDHDHECCPGAKACGRCVRGMLCRPCNVAVGMFKESPALLRDAAEYLEAHKVKLTL
jgi:hypothetical protein